MSASAVFRARMFVSACCSKEDVMIQIDYQPHLPIVANGPSPGADEESPLRFGAKGMTDSNRPGNTCDGSLYVSPPPMPFPRVFPGL